MARIDELKDNQWKSKDDQTALQMHKLKILLTLAYRSVHYYRKIFKENGIDLKRFDHRKDFYKIPLLSKKEINENRKLMISNAINRRKLLSNSTSGSTGEALYFFMICDPGPIEPLQLLEARRQ